MADIVDQGEGFGEGVVDAERGGGDAGDLGYFESVSEAAAGVIALVSVAVGAAGEDLGLAGEAAKGLGVKDAADVACKGRAVRMCGFQMRALGELTIRFPSYGDG